VVPHLDDDGVKAKVDIPRSSRKAASMAALASVVGGVRVSSALGLKAHQSTAAFVT
jgi:hypothetical protein